MMRRQSVAVLFLLLGLAGGIAFPYARQAVASAFSTEPPGYTASIYQDVAGEAPEESLGLTSTDVVNTGRDMPDLVAVVPSHRTVEPVTFEGLRDHHPVELQILHPGNGTIAVNLGPLAHGHSATLRMWWTPSGPNLEGEEPLFYGRMPQHPGTHDIRWLVHEAH
jgi:hypothetical protein